MWTRNVQPDPLGKGRTREPDLARGAPEQVRTTCVRMLTQIRVDKNSLHQLRGLVGGLISEREKPGCGAGVFRPDRTVHSCMTSDLA